MYRLKLATARKMSIPAQNLANLCHEALTNQHLLLCGFVQKNLFPALVTPLINEKHYSQYSLADKILFF